jgi:hypothetical protein
VSLLAPSRSRRMLQGIATLQPSIAANNPSPRAVAMCFGGWA